MTSRTSIFLRHHQLPHLLLISLENPFHSFHSLLYIRHRVRHIAEPAKMSLEATMIMFVSPIRRAPDSSIYLLVANTSQRGQQRKQQKWRLHVSVFQPKRPIPVADDYSSTRWQAQIDAVSVVHTAKMRVHPQSAVGLMSMGGKGPEVLSTFTTDFGGILSGLHHTKIHGAAHFCSSIQVAGV